MIENHKQFYEQTRKCFGQGKHSQVKTKVVLPPFAG